MKLALLEGSPRGTRSNTQFLLNAFREGWEQTHGRGENGCEVFQLIDEEQSGFAGALAAFETAPVVILAFPLYVDSMPAVVKCFIERLAPYRGKPGLPALGFVVHSGFPEAAQSYPVRRYLEASAEGWAAIAWAP